MAVCSYTTYSLVLNLYKKCVQRYCAYLFGSVLYLVANSRREKETYFYRLISLETICILFIV